MVEGCLEVNTVCPECVLSPISLLVRGKVSTVLNAGIVQFSGYVSATNKHPSPHGSKGCSIVFNQYSTNIQLSSWVQFHSKWLWGWRGRNPLLGGNVPTPPSSNA
jgi:hypothetical protein